jgi:hypothetical protein
MRTRITKLTLRSTPVIYWQEFALASGYPTSNRPHQLIRDVLVHITRKLERWGVFIPDGLGMGTFPKDNLPRYFENISYILSMDEIRDGESRIEPAGD